MIRPLLRIPHRAKRPSSQRLLLRLRLQQRGVAEYQGRVGEEAFQLVVERQEERGEEVALDEVEYHHQEEVEGYGERRRRVPVEDLIMYHMGLSTVPHSRYWGGIWFILPRPMSQVISESRTRIKITIMFIHHNHLGRRSPQYSPRAKKILLLHPPRPAKASPTKDHSYYRFIINIKSRQN